MLEGISEKLMCQICNVVFTDASSLGNHIHKAHAQLQHSLQSDGTKFSCHLCSVSFFTESDRDCHLQLEHGVKLKDEASAKPDISQNCQFCGRFFRHSSILNMHSISCEKLLGNSEGPEDYSDYVTLDESITFDEPQRTQNKNGSFKKSVAKRTSLLSSVLLDKSQIESKASKKNLYPSDSESIPVQKRPRQSKDSCEKRVSCAYCIKSFNGKYEAIAHVSKSHRNKLEEFLVWLQRRKLYLKDRLCSICDKTFTSSQEATEHVQNCHKNGIEEPLRCELCLIECSDELELLKHIANHSAPNGGSKLFFEVKNAETGNASISNAIAFNDLPHSVHETPVRHENIASCASSNTVISSDDTCDLDSGSNIVETSIYSNVSMSQNSSKEVCSDDHATVDVHSSKMDGTDLLIDSLLHDKEIIEFETNSEGNPCYQPNINLGSCNLDLPLLIDNSSTEKSSRRTPNTQLTHLSSTKCEIVDEIIPAPPP